MADRRDLDRYVEDETARALAARSRFVGWPLSLRLAASVALASVPVVVAAGLLLLMHARSEGASLAAMVFAASVTAVLFYGYAVIYAVNPARATKRSLRDISAYPTSAPGYRSDGADQRGYDSSDDGTDGSRDDP